ncbi:MAG TPA: hypothetical protein DEF43_14530 [Chloroflexus aurantiacus]|nr:hypothetical protein [Chloroflexus aurantiacus]
MPGGSALLQQCYHVLDGLSYSPIMCVAQDLECGSHAAAKAVLTIKSGVQQIPHRSLFHYPYVA